MITYANAAVFSRDFCVDERAFQLVLICEHVCSCCVIVEPPSINIPTYAYRAIRRYNITQLVAVLMFVFLSRHGLGHPLLLLLQSDVLCVLFEWPNPAKWDREWMCDCVCDVQWCQFLMQQSRMLSLHEIRKIASEDVINLFQQTSW